MHGLMLKLLLGVAAGLIVQAIVFALALVARLLL